MTCDECGCPFDCHGDRAVAACAGSISQHDLTLTQPIRLMRDYYALEHQKPKGQKSICPCLGFRLAAPVEDQDRSILERAKSLLVGAR